MEEQFDELSEKQLLKTTKDQLGYAEEYIIVKHENPKHNRLLNYSLSNSIEDIQIAIFARTGQVIDLEEAYWRMNQYLSVSVKHLMNSHKVNYAMTVLGEENNERIIVNMRLGDKWFFTDYREDEGKFIGTDTMIKRMYDYFRAKNEGSE